MNLFLIKIPTKYGWLTTYLTFDGLSYLFNRPADKLIDEAFKAKLGSTVFDVGAHIGWYTLKASKLVGPAGVVVSFEPSPKTFELLEQNTKHCENIKRINGAVSNFNGFAMLQLVTNPEEHSLVYSSKKRIKVQTITLDSFVTFKPDLIKIDVEGAELKVLQGAQKILRAHPKLIIETTQPVRTAKFLEQFGYKMRMLTEKDYLAGTHFS